MLNLGGPEILVILLVALLVLGPSRLPTAGKQIGRAIAEFRRVTSNVQEDLREVLDVEGVRDTVNSVRDVLDVPRTLRNEVSSAISSVGTTPVAGSSSSALESTRTSPVVHGLADNGVPSPDGGYADDDVAGFVGVDVPEPLMGPS